MAKVFQVTEVLGFWDHLKGRRAPIRRASLRNQLPFLSVREDRPFPPGLASSFHLTPRVYPAQRLRYNHRTTPADNCTIAFAISFNPTSQF